MNGKIYLHKEHGVNPTIPLCFVCGKEKNEVALLGSAYKDRAPMHMVIGIEPCDDCKTKYLKIAVLLVEVISDYSSKRKPTGSFMVIKDAAFERMFGEKPPAHKIALVESAIFQPIQKANA